MSKDRIWVEVFDLENPGLDDLGLLAEGEDGVTPIYIRIVDKVFVLASNKPITDRIIKAMKIGEE